MNKQCSGVITRPKQEQNNKLQDQGVHPPWTHYASPHNVKPSPTSNHSHVKFSSLFPIRTNAILYSALGHLSSLQYCPWSLNNCLHEKVVRFERIPPEWTYSGQDQDYRHQDQKLNKSIQPVNLQHDTRSIPNRSQMTQKLQSTVKDHTSRPRPRPPKSSLNGLKTKARSWE